MPAAATLVPNVTMRDEASRSDRECFMWPPPSEFRKFTRCPSLVNDDASAAEHCGRIRSVGGSHLVVIDDGIAAIPIPDLHPDLVRAAAAGNLAVPGCQLESVAP